MKKIFFTIIFVFYAFSAYGASSDDVYLRKDVFEAKMDAFMAEIRGEFKGLYARIDELDKRLSARIDGLEKRIDDLDAKLSTRISDLDIKLSTRISDLDSKLSTRISDLDVKLSTRISDLDAKLSTRIDSVDKRIDNLQNVFYLVLVLIGVIIALPFVQRGFEKLKENRKQSFTLEDVKKLIEENNAKMFEAINVKFATK